MNFGDAMTDLLIPSVNDKSKERNRKAKCDLLDFDSLPEYLKDNEFILSCYRCEWPMKDTLLSIFSVHNETLNVWTHLIGFLIFLILIAFTATMIPRESSYSIQNSTQVTTTGGIEYKIQNEITTCIPSPNFSGELPVPPLPGTDMLPPLSSWNLRDIILNCLPHRFPQVQNCTSPCFMASMKGDVTTTLSPVVLKPITRWPFFAFLGGAMFCLFISSVCHLISCHSECTAYFMLRLDYTGITSLIVTSFLPLAYYTFLCDPFFCNLYIGFITVFGVATVLVSLVPVFQTAGFRSVRAMLFCCMGVLGVVPIVHKIIVFGDRQEAIASAGYEGLMGIFYGLGVIIYTTRVPERWLPGKFDIVGHSHQLFHVLVIAGAYTHYLAGLEYLKWRDMEQC